MNAEMFKAKIIALWTLFWAEHYFLFTASGRMISVHPKESKGFDLIKELTKSMNEFKGVNG